LRILCLTPNNNKKKKKKKKPFFHLTKKKKKKKIFQNRFARFVTSNRVRKKLELLNSNSAQRRFAAVHAPAHRAPQQLHRCWQRRRGAAILGKAALCVVRRTGPVAAPAAAPAASAAAAAARDATMSQYWANLDPEGRTVWESIFGDVPMVEWSQFIAAYRSALGGGNQPINESGLKYLLDNAGTNTVSLYKFSEFLRGFGPLQDSARKSAELVEAPWFHGYLSSHEAESLLHNARPFTFLVRISKSRLGSFALAYLNESKEPQAHADHVDGAARLQDRGGGGHRRAAQSVCHNCRGRAALRQHSAVPVPVDAGARGVVPRRPHVAGGRRDARRPAQRHVPVPLLVLSGPLGRQLQRERRHAARQGRNGAGRLSLFKSKTDLQLYATLQQLVDDYKTLLSTPVLNTPWPSIEVGYHSGSAPRSPTPGGNGAVLASRQLPPPTRPGTAASHKGPNTTYVSMKGVGPGRQSAAASPARAMSPVRQARPGLRRAGVADALAGPRQSARRVAAARRQRSRRRRRSTSPTRSTAS
jgi:hypothetical protein